MSGCVRTVKLMEDGRRQVNDFLLSGDCFGFEALDEHEFAAEAVSDVVLHRYPRRAIDALAEREPGSPAGCSTSPAASCAPRASAW